MKRTILVILLGALAMSCAHEPRPIVYSKDECQNCRMKIMDERFGAEAVTEKGKVYKFDSAECMLQYLNSSDASENHAHLLTTYISQPNILQDATTSFFVVSKEIPSPMGGFLSSYLNKEQAIATVKNNGGEVYSWQEILEVYSTP